MTLPCDEWDDHQDYCELQHFVDNIQVVNDPAERTVQLAQQRISTVRSDEAFQQVVLTVDEMRRLSEGFKRNNFTKTELMSVVNKLLAA